METQLSPAKFHTLHLDSELRIQGFTSNAAELLGLCEQDVGRPLAPIENKLQLDSVISQMREVLRSGQVTQHEPIEHLGATYIVGMLPTRSAQAATGITLNLIDITALQETQRENENLQQIQHERLEMAMKAGSSSVWEWEPSSKTYGFSVGYGELLGFDPGEYQGDTADFADRLHPDDRERTWNLVGRHMTDGDKYDLEFRLRCKDGNYRWFRSCGESERDDRGVSTRMNGTVVDVNRRKLAEQQLLDQIRGRDEFLAMLSHELRNPLGAVTNAIGWMISQHLVDEEESAEFVDGMRIIDQQAKRMSLLLDDLLEVSRFTQKQIQYKMVMFDLESNCREAMETVRHLFESQQQTLEFINSDRPPCVVGDPDRIRQAQVNLLSNAAKFTERFGHIQLEIDSTIEEAVIRVRDSGEGLAPESIDRIFDLFNQADPALARANGGMGVGLSLTKQIIESHGGSITASSDGCGMGSTFELRLPKSQGAPLPTPVPEKYHFDGLKLLLVDDGDDARTMLSMILRQVGIDVVEACDGESAIAKAGNELPEVAVIDIGLPKMDGYGVASTIRASHGDSALLVALTGYGRTEDRIKALNAGFDEHLVKPLDPIDLYRLIAKRYPSSAAA